MKTDPNAACKSYREVRLWALLHDALAHPLMALAMYPRWAVRFHDWTSARAWPRVRPGPVVYAFQHPRANHVFVTGSCTALEAEEQALAWFADLESLGDSFRKDVQ